MPRVRGQQPPQVQLPRREPPQREPYLRIAKQVFWFALKSFAVVALATTVKAFSSRDTSPLSSEGFTSFPDSLDRYVHPGWMMNDLGNRACDLSVVIPKPEECDIWSQKLEEIHGQNGPVKDYLDSPASPSESGVSLSVKNSAGHLLTVAVGVEPKQLDNHKQALSYIEANFLEDPSFFSRPDEEILKSLKETNRLLAQGLDSESTSPAGQWRDHMIYIFPRVLVESGGDAEGARRSKMLEMATWTQREVLLKFYHLVDKVYDGYDGAYFALSPEEQETLKGVLDVPPKPSEIGREMLAFVKEFKHKGQMMERGEHDPLDFAAWVHHELVRIHPFGDANGRFGRAWKYGIERRGGYEPIVIDDKATYTQKLKNGIADFADYLRDLVGKRRVEGIKV